MIMVLSASGRNTSGTLKGSVYEMHKCADDLVGPAWLRDDRYIGPFLGDFGGRIAAVNDEWHAKLAQSPAYRGPVLSWDAQW